MKKKKKKKKNEQGFARPPHPIPWTLEIAVDAIAAFGHAGWAVGASVGGAVVLAAVLLLLLRRRRARRGALGESVSAVSIKVDTTSTTAAEGGAAEGERPRLPRLTTW